jgi:hypothetical protein
VAVTTIGTHGRHERTADRWAGVVGSITAVSGVTTINGQWHSRTAALTTDPR